MPYGVTGQDEDARLWDIVWMLRVAIAQQKVNGPEILFELLVKNEESRPPQPVTLKALIGPGDDTDPVITIMLPHEDGSNPRRSPPSIGVFSFSSTASPNRITRHSEKPAKHLISPPKSSQKRWHSPPYLRVPSQVPSFSSQTLGQQTIYQ